MGRGKTVFLRERTLRIPFTTQTPDELTSQCRSANSRGCICVDVHAVGLQFAGHVHLEETFATLRGEGSRTGVKPFVRDQPVASPKRQAAVPAQGPLLLKANAAFVKSQGLRDFARRRRTRT